MILRRTRGFTLVELIVVMVLVGVIAGVLVLQLRPALQSYLAVGRRANLVNQADSALHRIVADVHAAVPNSLRLLPSAQAGVQCIELVPTTGGGRYRIAPDMGGTVADTQAFDPQAPTKPFDVLTALAAVQDDYFVLSNENGGDVYSGENRAVFAAIDTARPLAAARARVTLKEHAPFATSYESGRFLVVSKNEAVVRYACEGAGSNADGSGTGTLRRIVGDFASAGSCPVAADAPVLATKVSDCAFVYSANGGATQQSGYLQLRLGLLDGGERATLTMGAHVENVP